MILLIFTVALGLYLVYGKSFIVRNNTVLSVPNKNSLNGTQEQITPSLKVEKEDSQDCSSGYDADAEYLFYMSKQSSVSELCTFHLFLDGYTVTGYSIDYPKNWKYRVVGAEASNVIFNEGINTGSNQELFIQVTATNLPLGQVDTATYGFEGRDTETLVNKNEKILSKKIEKIGENEVLNLLTEFEGKTIQRFFILKSEKNYSSLYMFAFISNNDEFVNLVRALVGSFDPNK